MTSFIDLLGDGGHVHFEKCGDIAVSPKDNVVAMFCHFCRDIFTHLPEFMRHLQRSHSDTLHFAKEQNVYSVEELLSMESSEDETQSQAHSCSSVDSGLAGETEDADAAPRSSACLASNVDIMNALAVFDVEVDAINVKCETQEVEEMLEERKNMFSRVMDNKPEAIQETYYKASYTENQKDFRRARKPGNLEKAPTICDVKSYNIARHSRKREAIKQRLSNVKKRIMLSLENDVPKSVPMKVSSVKLELPAFKEESKHPGVEATKLPPTNLETKEIRSNMTQVIQYNGMKSASMKQLLKPRKRPVYILPKISTSSSVDSKKVPNAALTNLKSTTSGSTTLIKPVIPASLRQPLAEKKPKTFRINMPLSKVNQVVSNSVSPSFSSATKQSKLPALLDSNSANDLAAPLEPTKSSKIVSATPIKKRCVASTSKKPTILPCTSGTAFKIDPNISHAPTGRRSSPIKIERVQILSKIAKDIKQNVETSVKGKPIWKKRIPSSVASVKSSELNATNNDAVDQHKRPERRSSLTVVSNSPVQTKKRTRRSSMTTVKPTPPPSSQKLHSGPVQGPAKAQKRSPSTEICDAKRAKINQERCSMNFGLSSSAIEFLQKDLKTSKLDADSLLQLAETRGDSIVEDLVAQIKETKEENTQKKELITPQTPEIQVVGDDLKLLETVGLRIIKVPKFEDKMPLEQSEEFRKKAAKFSKIYHKYETIWSYRKSKIIGAPERLVQQLNAFTEEVNKELACQLTLSEMKRTLNLINSWYTEQIDKRFFRKATLSYSIEHYMLLFHFLPKIITTVYFCEYCEETFTHESRYKKHVQSLHTLHAFTCAECGKSFKRLYFYEKHLKAAHNVSPITT
ncbi:protein teflon isoform X2 [Drosophila subobscura]|uniref:protein teflon isoform X2 n=1 Tax=Drosophila subobscura TaxID=7241 RepID=UPI00155A98C2|nr:protein teflon isoform X2 [Drosophila subobscura]